MSIMVIVCGGCGEEIKVHTETYSNGDLKEEYQYYNHHETNSMIKSGWYKSYHEDGKYSQIGSYKEDKKDSEWILYYKNG